MREWHHATVVLNQWNVPGGMECGMAEWNGGMDILTRWRERKLYIRLCTLAPANAHYAMPWILWPRKDPWVYSGKLQKEEPKVIEDQEQELSQEEFI